MFASRNIVRVSLVSALFAFGPGLVACGGGKPAESPIPKAGDMPEGAEWTGVYYNPVYGNLHLIKEGGTASGKWRTVEGDKWGEMSGNVTGNLFLFEWKQTTIGMVGPSATTTGRGFFQYVRPPGDNVNDEIRGQWGLGTDRTGVPWNGIKQRNAKPDPNSVMPDETQKSQNSNWDESNPKKGGGDSQKSDDGWN